MSHRACLFRSPSRGRLVPRWSLDFRCGTAAAKGCRVGRIDGGAPGQERRADRRATVVLKRPEAWGPGPVPGRCPANDAAGRGRGAGGIELPEQVVALGCEQPIAVEGCCRVGGDDAVPDEDGAGLIADAAANGRGIVGDRRVCQRRRRRGSDVVKAPARGAFVVLKRHVPETEGSVVEDPSRERRRRVIGDSASADAQGPPVHDCTAVVTRVTADAGVAERQGARVADAAAAVGRAYRSPVPGRQPGDRNGGRSCSRRRGQARCRRRRCFACRAGEARRRPVMSRAPVLVILRRRA